MKPASMRRETPRGTAAERPPGSPQIETLRGHAPTAPSALVLDQGSPIAAALGGQRLRPLQVNAVEGGDGAIASNSRREAAGRRGRQSQSVRLRSVRLEKSESGVPVRPGVCGERRTLKGRCAGRPSHEGGARFHGRRGSRRSKRLAARSLRAKPRRAARPRTC